MQSSDLFSVLKTCSVFGHSKVHEGGTEEAIGHLTLHMVSEKWQHHGYGQDQAVQERVREDEKVEDIFKDIKVFG